MWKGRKKKLIFVCVRQKGMKSWAIVGVVDIPAHKLAQIVSSSKWSVFCPKTLRDHRPHANRLTIRQRSGRRITYIVTQWLSPADEARRSVCERQWWPSLQRLCDRWATAVSLRGRRVTRSCVYVGGLVTQSGFWTKPRGCRHVPDGICPVFCQAVARLKRIKMSLFRLWET